MKKLLFYIFIGFSNLSIGQNFLDKFTCSEYSTFIYDWLFRSDYDTLIVSNVFLRDSIKGCKGMDLMFKGTLKNKQCNTVFHLLSIHYADSVVANLVWNNVKRTYCEKEGLISERYKAYDLFFFKRDSIVYMLPIYDSFILSKYCNEAPRLLYNYYLNTYKELLIGNGHSYIQVSINGKELYVKKKLAIDENALRKITVIK